MNIPPTVMDAAIGCVFQLNRRSLAELAVQLKESNIHDECAVLWGLLWNTRECAPFKFRSPWGRLWNTREGEPAGAVPYFVIIVD